MSTTFSPTIAIIGGGFGGITMAARLKMAGFHDFVVLEADSGPGGTWYSNTYPGSEVDVHSRIYSLPFKDYEWSRTHARRDELYRYIEEALDDFDIRRHFRFNTRVSAARWDEDAKSWHLSLDGGAVETYHVVVSAVGLLSDPKEIAWPGVDRFEGRLFHSQRWPADLDLRDKRVAVVGVGSTAAQIVPAIAPDVRQMYVYQREPGWILPKGDRTYDRADLVRLSSPLNRKIERLRLLAKSEWAHTYQPIYLTGSKRNKRGERIALEYLNTMFGDRPDLKKALTPTYAFSGKRRVLSDDYFPALKRDNVELVPHSVSELTATGIIDSTGEERDVDVVVAAIGYKASTFLSSLDVTGRGGKRLREEWRDGAYAFVGMAVPDFPNFYMMYGPNTNGGAPITMMHDQQAHYVVANVRRMARRGIRVIDVRRRAVRLYNRWLQGRMENTAWLEGNNYFKGPHGQIVTQWRDGLLLYGFLLRALRLPGSRAE
ncbi:MAG TPA: NAD(P)/FAD-dependent oxidoreductase [Amycolatopsis sp.]|nr:NAD(P)/FAD-dependent oxidoreductase [Amycolatopsis sp.]